ncbi:uncharacterized protein LOC130805504 [Amaranthus tricolor]|uniref:uncharacterized protein LOC130805504 n=1 Tax=Amaranthus tricolor TaxID=29722 RepID=UPI00258C614A|nr:uncharacterized protein LOC130805504 [Amaranthus tricolor]
MTSNSGRPLSIDFFIITFSLPSPPSQTPSYLPPTRILLPSPGSQSPPIALDSSQAPTLPVSLSHHHRRNNQISGRFWEQYAEEIYSYVSKPENNKSFVIIIQYAKVKLWRGTTSLTNSMFITRLTIEPDIHEVHEFKNRRKLNDGSIIQRSLLDESNHNLKSSELIFLHNHEAVQLKDIVLLQKEGYYVTYGTITSINCEHEWSYSSCYKCYDAVQKESDGSMSCLTCKVPILIVWPRYKIFVRVSDGVGQSTFVLFDSQVKKELQVTAKELIDKQVKNGDIETFPEELEKLINKKYLFVFKVNKYFNIEKKSKSYSVRKLTDDEELILKFCQCLYSKKENDNTVESKEHSTSMNQDIMQNCDSTTENSNFQTPIKGGLEKVIDISDCEYSTNKKTVEDQINTKRVLDNIYDISDLECSTSKKHIVVKEKDPIIN